VTQVQDLGTHLLVSADAGGHPLKARAGRRPRVAGARRGAWLQVLGGHTCFYRDEELVA
jgi:glycerol transport system ATP-binding protein